MFLSVANSSSQENQVEGLPLLFELLAIDCSRLPGSVKNQKFKTRLWLLERAFTFNTHFERASSGWCGWHVMAFGSDGT